MTEKSVINGKRIVVLFIGLGVKEKFPTFAPQKSIK
jgi:hypothetical protein